jgi:glycosyltransferase involved in cell wall biosynthesis
MKILLLGDNPKNFWIGSSTLYIQREYSKALGKKLPDVVDLFLPYQRREILRFLFGSIKINENTFVTEINGGIIPLLFYCFKNKYSIVHCVLIRNYMIWIVLMARFIHLSTIVTLHDTSFIPDQKLSISKISKLLLLKFATCVFVLSKTDEERVKNYNRGIKFYFIKNGITTVSDHREITNSKKILFGGGIGSSNKGLNYLEASLRKINGNPDLIICGTNPTAGKHPAYYGEVSREEFYKLICSARIVIISSEFESFSMIALESLSLGTPIIITESCGICSYLTDGIDCIKIPYGDVEALKISMEKLLKDDVLWNSLSENGRKTARNFLWDNIILEVVDIYKEKLTGPINIKDQIKT